MFASSHALKIRQKYATKIHSIFGTKSGTGLGTGALEVMEKQRAVYHATPIAGAQKLSKS